MTLAEMLEAMAGETSASSSVNQVMASTVGQMLLKRYGSAATLFMLGLDFGLEITKRYGRPSDEEEFEVVNAPRPREYRFGE